MNALETVNAAMATLAGLRANCSPGPWETFKDHEGVRLLHAAPAGSAWDLEPYERSVIIDGSYSAEAGTVSPNDGELIVTLHRTIRAQMWMLQATAKAIRESRGAASHEGPGIDLARAILGER